MKYILSIIIFIVPMYFLHSQNAGQVSKLLQNFSNHISQLPCDSNEIATHRAINIYLADKIGYYLSDEESQSFRKNNITLNTGTGNFSLTHSNYEPSGLDEPIKTFTSIGIKANVLNAIAARVSGNAYNNEFGMLWKKTWVGKTKTTLNNCTEKFTSDASRQIILQQLQTEIKQKEDVFEASLSNIKKSNISDSDFVKMKADLAQSFYADLRFQYTKKFAEVQYQDLFNTTRFKTITRSWTNLNIYIPAIRQRFIVAENFGKNFDEKYNFPIQLSVVHTKFILAKNTGKFYLSFKGGLSLNNSSITNNVTNFNYSQYQSLGGKDTAYLLHHNLKNAFVGAYQNFITPNAAFQFVFFPGDTHIGISAKIEQNFGTYNPLNFQLGVPVVLIHPEGSPAMNFEMQVKYFDITHSVFPNRNFADNLSINFSVGIPFSKIIF